METIHSFLSEYQVLIALAAVLLATFIILRDRYGNDEPIDVTLVEDPSKADGLVTFRRSSGRYVSRHFAYMGAYRPTRLNIARQHELCLKVQALTGLGVDAVATGLTLYQAGRPMVCYDLGF